MKKSVVLILSCFVCMSSLAQGLEKRYYENTSDIGGDVAIKSSNVEMVENEIYNTFEIESAGEGAYYLDAWIIAPFTKDGYVEYKVAVNGVQSRLSLKPQTDGWHSLALTDARKSAATVNLKKGINTVSIIGKGPEVPCVEFIKLSSSLSRTGISDAKYREFVESIQSGALSETYNSYLAQTGFGRGTNGEIYDYALDLPYNFTHWWALSFSVGQNISVSAGSSNFPCGIELFHISDPNSYSWSARSTTGASILNATIPTGGSGYYVLLVRSLNPVNMGLIAVTVDDGYGISTVNDCIVTYSPQVSVSPGYPVPANFFTCKTVGDGNWMFLADNSGRFRAYNYDGGTTSDGYVWGIYNTRITTTLSNIDYGLVFRKYVYEPNYCKTDLYMGLAAPSNNYNGQGATFDSLCLDNSFISANSGYYNCYAWSVEINDGGSLLPFKNNWDSLYNSHGYIRDGATPENAAIALWGYVQNVAPYDTVFRHASVRKNSNSQYPHGFEWESKIGVSGPRIMHTRDALAKNPMVHADDYGSIIRYYRPDPGRTVINRLPSRESSFLESDLNRITALKSQIPATVLSGFEEKYLAWEKTWSSPEFAFHSDPFMYAKSSEYENLLEYCMKYGKAIWSLLIDKFSRSPKEIFVINLIRDLTYTGNPNNFGSEIIRSVLDRGEPYPTLNYILGVYCKGLLENEEVNMLKSIQALSAMEEESLVANVSTVNSGEIMLSLVLEKDEKALVTIYNILGGHEYEAGYNLSKGNQTVVINVSNLKKGAYIIRIVIGDKTMSQTISI